jgi:signal transduction histidine kinase
MFSSPYRSLYWRIGIGFILCIAAILAVQGIVLLWLLDRADPDSRASLTLGVSNDLAQALTTNPDLNVEQFIAGRYPNPPRAFYAVMVNGQVTYFGNKRPLPGAVLNVKETFKKPQLTAIPRLWEAAPYWASPVIVNGYVAGTVAVVPENLVELLWRPMVALAGVLLFVGTVAASFFIFAPAHRRLRDLERTARRLGAGDLAARAEEAGGDEVASLARTFNRMADDLAARSEQIAEHDRTRRLLLADVSHELATPLTAVRGYQEKLADDAVIRQSAERLRYVSIIGEETLRVERIVRDLLDLARLESIAPSLDMQDVSVEGLFGRVRARHEGEAVHRHVTLCTQIEHGAELAYGDPFRLEQALQNLAANALRHVPPGGRVDLGARQLGGELEIVVRDTGRGIEPEHLPFIFDRFYKVDRSRAAGSEGSGLGLSIVKAIVERHGGRIAVASQPGVDTRFTVQLPAAVTVF